jgi:hypothetical protein
VDAIPSVVRIGPAGGPEPSRFKDVANTKGPSNDRLSYPSPARGSRCTVGCFAGKRFATMVDRGALNARPTQGRVGGFPRHVSHPHAVHPLFLVESSVRLRALRSRPRSVRGVEPQVTWKDRTHTSQRQARTPASSFRHVLRKNELAAPLPPRNRASGKGRSRGKGVRAA